MDLPSKYQPFDFEFVNEFGKKYDGTFTVLCSLNVGQKHALELEKTRLLGAYSNPTDALAGLAIILSNLRVKITDGPNWWLQSNGGSNIEEEEMLVALYRKVQETEDKWRNDLKEKAKKSQETTATPESAPSTSTQS